MDEDNFFKGGQCFIAVECRGGQCCGCVALPMGSELCQALPQCDKRVRKDGKAVIWRGFETMKRDPKDNGMPVYFHNR